MLLPYTENIIRKQLNKTTNNISPRSFWENTTERAIQNLRTPQIRNSFTNSLSPNLKRGEKPQSRKQCLSPSFQFQNQALSSHQFEQRWK